MKSDSQKLADAILKLLEWRQRRLEWREEQRIKRMLSRRYRKAGLPDKV